MTEIFSDLKPTAAMPVAALRALQLIYGSQVRWMQAMGAPLEPRLVRMQRDVNDSIMRIVRDTYATAADNEHRMEMLEVMQDASLVATLGYSPFVMDEYGRLAQLPLTEIQRLRLSMLIAADCGDPDETFDRLYPAAHSAFDLVTLSMLGDFVSRSRARQLTGRIAGEYTRAVGSTSLSSNPIHTTVDGQRRLLIAAAYLADDPALHPLLIDMAATSAATSTPAAADPLSLLLSTAITTAAALTPTA